ncbi:Rad4-domain-containing protein [Coniochaeta ligniaria NRRL 30616]|uniref:Rad4-domain-containing protein n=1 Tax=Coniochaeta ligniaria NRRL 30616 TaxID=1408157 RepID=A0A1J7IAX5_9PEZI|nr:Rad4-domain-containing protein [Coniochaeta ligniaria NRRL 30616]
MAGKKRPAPSDGGGRRVSSRLRGSATKSNDVVPDIYRQMLAEAGTSTSASRHDASDIPERPLKRRRPGERAEKNARQKVEENKLLPSAAQNDTDEEDIEFEDVPAPAPNLQTIPRDSDDEDDEDAEMLFEDVDFGALDLAGYGPADDAPKELNLNLTVQEAAMTPAKRAIDRRKPATKEEKERRVHVHKMHVLCLLCHVSMRNRWCNDPEVQAALRPLLTAKMVKFLNPATNVSQFGRTESLKKGLQEVATMFKTKYTITERGIRRALWAEDESQLQDYSLPDDIESTLERSDFLEAAKTLKGSRDVGAQLFCALLRCAGVTTRLVCSLQPLACTGNAPTMPRQRKVQTPALPSAAERMRAARAVYDQYTTTPTETGTPSPRRRLGHPHAAAYNIPSMSYTPTSSRTVVSPPTAKRIKGESPFPVYWVEVLDIALQKWQPVDPLVTSTQFKPRALEPPASDRENCMTYAIGFEADGSAKDVTRRYAKAYNSKTRKMRVDGLGAPADGSNAATARPPGERWWRRTMRRFAKAYPADADQIEDNELAAAEAREPMPRNVGDFKDHPVYALERHLRRHEVLVPGAQPAGTVGAGSKGPLERIYRRRDVRVARSRDRWYRLGRVVMPGEEPVKVLPKKKKARRGIWDDEESEREEEEEQDLDPDKVGLFGEELVVDGTPIYMYEQTEAYVPEPVRNGRVPRNKFGNVDVYVPSMVPAGGAHVLHDRAAHAAFILGVDYAPALTGFKFSGRKGTAVLSGVVVPAEAEEGVWAAIAGMEDLEAEAEKERKARVALRWWKRFLMGLRIRERIWANVDPNEEKDGGMDRDGDAVEDGGFAREDKGKGVAGEEDDMDLDGAVSDATEELDFVEDEDGGGGFLVDDDDAGGGFMVE